MTQSLRVRVRSVGALASVWFLGNGLFGCAGAVESSRLEDQARRQVPVAICLVALERYGSGGVVPALKPPDYWRLVLPSYNEADESVDTSSADCAGRQLFSGSMFRSARVGSVTAKSDQVQVTDAPGKLKVVWFKTHLADGDAVGPLALTRAFAGRAEVYAIGVHAGAADKTQFEVERVGPRLFITASDGGCAGVAAGSECETTMQVYMMTVGRILQSAEFKTDRVRTLSVDGRPVEFRFNAIPEFTSQGFRLKEQLSVQDPSQPAVQKSTLERPFKLGSEGKLVPQKDSLWTRVAK